MKDLSRKELYAMLEASHGCLSSMKTVTSHRRHVYDDDPRDFGDPFLQDAKALRSSKGIRRLAHKNQVATCPSMTHVRSRLVHTEEVEANAVWLGDILGLNTKLIGASSVGHDIGHPALGHQGEEYIQRRTGKPFTHEVFGVVLLQYIERRGNGGNLTHACLDAMLRHSGKNFDERMTQEARVLRIEDKVSYLYADYNDFARMQWRCSPEVDRLINWFGTSQRDRVLRTGIAICDESMRAGTVQFETSEAAINFAKLRTAMYEEYVKIVEQNLTCQINRVWDFLEGSKLVPPEIGFELLTDHELFSLSKENMLRASHVMATGLGEIIKLMPDRDYLFSIDPYNPDLDW